MKCAENTCQLDATLHFTMAEKRRGIDYQNLCKQHGGVFLSSQLKACEQATQVPKEKPTEVICDFEVLVYDDEASMAWVVLRESIGPQKGNRCLTVKAGYSEASVISTLLFGTQSHRPVTHDAFVNAIILLGGKIGKVLIDDYDEREGCFVAKVELHQNDQQLILDVRPSDALVLALIANVPIFVGPAVIQQRFSGRTS